MAGKRTGRERGVEEKRDRSASANSAYVGVVSINKKDKGDTMPRIQKSINASFKELRAAPRPFPTCPPLRGASRWRPPLLRMVAPQHFNCQHCCKL